jgi:carbonic anhydrase
MNRLVSVQSIDDIFDEYKNTPIQSLLEYHNLKFPLETSPKAEILISMCMDNRKMLRTPDNFAYILRAGGGSLRNSEFKVSFAIGFGGISAIALVAHSHCNMVNLKSKKEQIISGLISNAGWNEEEAKKHFEQFSHLFEIGNEIDFILSESKRLRAMYPKILVAPLFYKLEDNLLYLIEETKK